MRFAVIAEGLTDIAVLENIFTALYGDAAVVNALMPLRDETDKSRAKADTFSNWELVFEYLGTNQISVALATNDFLVVHVETDMGEHANYGLPLTAHGRTRPIEEIVLGCRQLLLSKLPNDLSSADLQRIIFAVPVLSTECWLVGLFDGKHRHTPSKVNNCLGRLKACLKGSAKTNKDYRTYLELGRGFRKPKILNDVRARMPCLDAFVASLPPHEQVE
jgi:hypothetical protein